MTGMLLERKRSFMISVCNCRFPKEWCIAYCIIVSARDSLLSVLWLFVVLAGVGVVGTVARA